MKIRVALLSVATMIGPSAAFQLQTRRCVIGGGGGVTSSTASTASSLLQMSLGEEDHLSSLSREWGTLETSVQELAQSPAKNAAQAKELTERFPETASDYSDTNQQQKTQEDHVEQAHQEFEWAQAQQQQHGGDYEEEERAYFNDNDNNAGMGSSNSNTQSFSTSRVNTASEREALHDGFVADAAGSSRTYFEGDLQEQQAGLQPTQEDFRASRHAETKSGSSSTDYAGEYEDRALIQPAGFGAPDGQVAGINNGGQERSEAAPYKQKRVYQNLQQTAPAVATPQGHHYQNPAGRDAQQHSQQSQMQYDTYASPFQAAEQPKKPAATHPQNYKTPQAQQQKTPAAAVHQRKHQTYQSPFQAAQQQKTPAATHQQNYQPPQAQHRTYASPFQAQQQKTPAATHQQNYKPPQAQHQKTQPAAAQRQYQNNRPERRQVLSRATSVAKEQKAESNTRQTSALNDPSFNMGSINQHSQRVERIVQPRAQVRGQDFDNVVEQYDHHDPRSSDDSAAASSIQGKMYNDPSFRTGEDHSQPRPNLHAQRPTPRTWAIMDTDGRKLDANKGN